jgi:hypothetical protein
MYRRLAIQAKQQRSRASDPEIRQGLADIADHWAGLAEESDWLEKRLAKLGCPTAKDYITRPVI